MSKIEFRADDYSVNGPRKSDGSYKVSFETGEYEQLNVAKLMVVPQRTILKVTVEYDDE